MKKLILSLILLFIWFMGSSQGCLPQGITFISQAQIDSFQIKYPNCTKIEGRVNIGRELRDDSNLKGTANSRTGDGYINNLNGLSVLTSIGSDLFIYYDTALTSLTGLNNSTSVGGSLIISANTALTSLAGLSNLDSIGKGIIIAENYVLTSLTGLEKVMFIGGDLDITYNITLTSLAGIDNIHSASITNLQVSNNNSLSTCAVKSICNYLANPGGTIEIENNLKGCNSEEEVKDSCGIYGVENLPYDKIFSIYPNPSFTQISVEISVTHTNSQLSIMNLNSQEVLTHRITESKTIIDVSTLHSGVYFVRVTNDKTVEEGKFVKQ